MACCFADGILLGGILIMYEFHKYLRFILLLVHSFWIPQIVINVVRDSRKPMHPHYIIGMSITRLAIPLYIFGCPHNFMRTKPDKDWCICLGVFVGLQASMLLLQHYLGSRWFIPRQVRCDWYVYTCICLWIDIVENAIKNCFYLVRITLFFFLLNYSFIFFHKLKLFSFQLYTDTHIYIPFYF